MASNTPSLEKTGIRYGIYGGLAMIVYFLILKVIGLDSNDTVRFLGMLLIIVATGMAIYYYSRHKSKGMYYLSGLGIGFIVGLVSALVNGIFMFLYTYFVDQKFTADLRTQDYFGSNLSPLMLFGANALLGIMIGAFTGYITMMYFDRSRSEDKVRKEANEI
ncbi:hypothetical protein AHMF7605_05595 [Adhaeribacter arboris]|uniref:DUF4199 domain-containing protein n=1 Tax=Adhaeribacter arboris TaxID=2072846 RepID=A0A2T2YBZ9_9BACT|nr:DUF4199 domain-containing protein [Adhaeribacter arboris]PSR53037.1 hypothetical protein AHMF7605_05595 [Adhaeribacter arboris]